MKLSELETGNIFTFKDRQAKYQYLYESNDGRHYVQLLPVLNPIREIEKDIDPEVILTENHQVKQLEEHEQKQLLLK